MGIEIIPTCVPRSREELVEAANLISAFAPLIHIDIVDGIFAPARTWPYTDLGVFEAPDLSQIGGLVAEIHLMVEEPLDIGTRFAEAGAKRIIGHIEAFDDEDRTHSTLRTWQRAGAEEVGLGILMHTPLEVLAYHEHIANVFQLMTIASIGTQGIPYEERAPTRVAEAHARFPKTILSVDGGVATRNIESLARAGARRFCAGSAISMAADHAAAYRELTSLARRAIS